MRPLALSTLLLAITAAPAMAQMSLPPQPLGTLPTAVQPAPMYTSQPAPMGTSGARPGNEIGTGRSEPLSDKAGNIGPSDTTTPYAARLPNPGIGENADPRAYLQAARNSLAAGRTGEAQEAMERAETRLLIRSVVPSRANIPNQEPVVQQISEARQALGMGDRAGAMAKLNAALNNPELGQSTR